MKIITLLLLLNCAFSYSQNYFTRGEVFDFEVGDIIQSHYYYNQYNTYTTKHYLNKIFSSNSDTIYYTIEQEVYIPACCFQGSLPSFTLDTIFEYYYNLYDTLHYPSPTPLTFEDSCNYRKDSLYLFDFGINCPLTTYKNWTASLLPSPGLCSAESSWDSQLYYKGLGYYYSSAYMDIQNVYTGMELVYFKKDGQECGTFVTHISEINLSNEVQLYPNPASDKIEIQSDVLFDNYEIFSVDGNKIQSESILGKEIQISDLSSGIYFLELKSKANTIVRKRFVKN